MSENPETLQPECICDNCCSGPFICPIHCTCWSRDRKIDGQCRKCGKYQVTAAEIMAMRKKREVEPQPQAGQQPVCIHCAEAIYDNGTVYVHHRYTTSLGKLVVLHTQWCDTTKKTMAETATLRDMRLCAECGERVEGERLIKEIREWAVLIHHGQYHQWKDFGACTDKGCQRRREVLKRLESQ